MGLSVLIYAILSDGAQPHLITTGLTVERPKKTTAERHDEDDDDGGESRH